MKVLERLGALRYSRLDLRACASSVMGKKLVLDWFKSGEAVEIGTALADEFSRKTAKSREADAIQEILQSIEARVRTLRLNFYKRARLANSFKWRLIENGVDKETADQITQTLAVRLAIDETRLGQETQSDTLTERPAQGNTQQLLARGKRFMTEGAYAEAILVYQDLLLADPGHVLALNLLGAAYFYEGQYKDAEDCFRQAIRINPSEPDGHGNLGSTLRARGYYAEAESSLRRALKLNPTHLEARINLGLVLTALNRLRDAKGHFNKVLKSNPRNVVALNGMASIVRTEGRLEEADRLVQRVLDIDPKMPGALESLAFTRKMTPADIDWLQRVEGVIADGVPPQQEADLHYAIGKYCDDVQDYSRAFQSFERANDLQKSMAEEYDRDGHRLLVDEFTRVFTPERVRRATAGASDSMKPVLVVGMPRSGTSLVEQIISSHPSAKGAGELGFWAETAREHGIAIGQGSLQESTVRKLTKAYLSMLAHQVGDATRIVDKAPVNSDYLGLIHPLFPNARIIYMRRDPIDTCLSCYFQKFIVSLNYTMDLEDLAHYYREHHRLMTHWRAVLPVETLLDVPYAELVADQEGWTRKILNFLDLPWDDRCLEFHKTQRAVATASFWQVRQKIYGGSVERWRKYEKFIGPLLSLKELDR